MDIDGVLRVRGNVQRPPISSGNLTLVNNSRRTPIFMKLSEHNPEQYAVLYRKEDCEYQYGCFDYKNCIVKAVPGRDRQFDVTKTDTDSGLRFEAPSPLVARKWMESFGCINVKQTDGHSN